MAFFRKRSRSLYGIFIRKALLKAAATDHVPRLTSEASNSVVIFQNQSRVAMKARPKNATKKFIYVTGNGIRISAAT